ncbi:MAG: hypothetical protein ABJH63_06025 [Rhizobiaceae bacterium]
MNLFNKAVRTISAAAIATASFIVPLTPSSAALLDLVIQHKTFPECHDDKVLRTIIKRFNGAENQNWQRGFTLSEIERTRETLGQSTYESPIPRRYCRGHALLSNGKHPTVFYLIEGGQGLAGNSFNVEFCISGLDEWNDYDGSCRAIRY